MIGLLLLLSLAPSHHWGTGEPPGVPTGRSPEGSWVTSKVGWRPTPSAAGIYAPTMTGHLAGFRLAGIDHVIDFRDITKMWMIFFSLGSGYPTIVLVGIAIKLAVPEIAPQETELPHVIGDIFTDVTYGAVGTHDDLLIFFRDA